MKRHNYSNAIRQEEDTGVFSIQKPSLKLCWIGVCRLPQGCGIKQIICETVGLKYRKRVNAVYKCYLCYAVLF